MQAREQAEVKKFNLKNRNVQKKPHSSRPEWVFSVKMLSVVEVAGKNRERAIAVETERVEKERRWKSLTANVQLS